MTPILSAALEAKCDVLHSEDIQHGLLVEGRLQIIHSFAAVAGQLASPHKGVHERQIRAFE